MASVPLWLAGTFGIFLAAYGLAIGVLGLFAWPRRHALLFTLLSLVMICALIVNIILRAVGKADCIPWTGVDGDDDSSGPIRDVYCGNKIATFITHGILIGFLVSQVKSTQTPPLSSFFWIIYTRSVF